MRPIPTLVMLPAAIVATAPAVAAEYLTIPQAQKALFPDADQFRATPLLLTDAQRDAIRERSGVRQRNERQDVWRAEKNGTLLGWVIVDEVVGKHEFITYAAGLSPEGSVRGIEILVYRETYGYQVRNADWRQRFVGKTVKDPFKLDQDIPNITGATLSCRNVMNGVKRLLVLHQLALANQQ